MMPAPPLFIATFKTPEGEIAGRAQRANGIVVASAQFTDSLDHTLVLRLNGGLTGEEWQHGEKSVAAPTNKQMSPIKKTALRNVVHAMQTLLLSWEKS